ncbi:hypothetical protein LCGC14_1048150 [marine sediment metagenome]|uniref:Uncharacterized protein n=1 Tax=marine sediment metagenome TaxID=412755 RepID=A0A0F9MU60_9ZZZZ
MKKSDNLDLTPSTSPELVTESIPMNTIHKISINKHCLIILHHAETVPSNKFHDAVVNRFNNTLRDAQHLTRGQQRKSVKAKATRIIEDVISIMNVTIGKRT